MSRSEKDVIDPLTGVYNKDKAAAIVEAGKKLGLVASLIEAGNLYPIQSGHATSIVSNGDAYVMIQGRKPDDYDKVWNIVNELLNPPKPS